MLRTLLPIPIGLLAATLAACGGGFQGAAPCTGDSDCNLRPGGMCLPSPLGTDQCAYPDGACPGGFSWSELSGAISGTCTEQCTVPAAGPECTDGACCVVSAQACCNVVFGEFAFCGACEAA